MEAHRQANVEVLGYLVWSLLDSYEFTENYRCVSDLNRRRVKDAMVSDDGLLLHSRKFGLVHVDFEGGSLNRTLKESAWFFQYIGKEGKVPKVEFDFKIGSGAASTITAFSLAALVFVSALAAAF